MLSGEVANTNFVVFGFDRTGYDKKKFYIVCNWIVFTEGRVMTFVVKCQSWLRCDNLFIWQIKAFETFICLLSKNFSYHNFLGRNHWTNLTENMQVVLQKRFFFSLGFDIQYGGHGIKQFLVGWNMKTRLRNHWRVDQITRIPFVKKILK